MFLHQPIFLECPVQVYSAKLYQYFIDAFKDVVKIKSQLIGELSLQLMSPIGQELHTEKFEMETIIHLENFPEGIYFLIVTDINGNYSFDGLIAGTYKVMLDPLSKPAGVDVTGDGAVSLLTDDVALASASGSTCGR